MPLAMNILWTYIFIENISTVSSSFNSVIFCFIHFTWVKFSLHCNAIYFIECDSPRSLWEINIAPACTQPSCLVSSLLKSACITSVAIMKNSMAWKISQCHGKYVVCLHLCGTFYTPRLHCPCYFVHRNQESCLCWRCFCREYSRFDN